MTTTHTPGPWTALDGGAVADSPHFAIETEPMTQYRIADVYDEANARLIAAAPDLLAALKAVQWRYSPDDLMGEGFYCISCGAKREHNHRVACSVGAAIAHAEGGAL